MSEELEGCQYSICCHNDEYKKMQQENSQLKQQLKDKDEKISKVKEFVLNNDLYSIETVESEETKYRIEKTIRKYCFC